MHETVLEVVVGSTTHGTSVDDGLEDLDLMRIVVEDRPCVLGFEPTDTWVERTKPEGVRSEAGDTDLVIYGLRKYLRLALRANPTVLIALFVGDKYINVRTNIGEELQALAPKIASKRAINTFKGYAHQQHKRLLGTAGQMNVTRPELIERYGFDTKYAGHVIRLCMQGVEYLNTGKLTLPMTPADRQVVVDVRNGVYTLPQVSRMISVWEELLIEAGEHSQLPDEPDTAFVEAWMMDQYSSVWAKQARIAREQQLR